MFHRHLFLFELQVLVPLLMVIMVIIAVHTTPSAGSCTTPIVSGQVNVDIDGTTTQWSIATSNLAGAKVAADGSSVTVMHNNRAYIVSGCPASFTADTFGTRMPLLGRLFNYTVDLSKVPCACNAALYTVFMPAFNSSNQPDPTKCGDYYCDGNQVCGVYCPEMDIMEANTMALQVTPHACGAPTGKYYPTCDHGGCAVNTRQQTGNVYGPGSSFQIDTTQPFVVSTAFYADANTQQLTKIVTTLSQPQRRQPSSQPVYITHTDSDCSRGGYLEDMTTALAQGMVPTLSVWGDTAATMSWLDIPPCSTSQNCDPSSSMIISGLSLSVL